MCRSRVDPWRTALHGVILACACAPSSLPMPFGNRRSQTPGERAGHAAPDHRAARQAAARGGSRPQAGGAAPRPGRVAGAQAARGRAAEASSTRLHPADIAYILEALPLDQRLRVWDLVKADRDGEILLESPSRCARPSSRTWSRRSWSPPPRQLDTDEIADLAPDLPDDVMDDVFKALPVEEREQLRAAMSYREDAVGALMDFDLVTVRDDRHAGSRAALSAAPGRAARSHRPAVRGGPQRGAAWARCRSTSCW